MAVLRVKDKKGNVVPIPAIKGEKGDAGTGVHVGCYVGDCPAAAAASQYIDLGSPCVSAVLLQIDGAMLLVTEEGVTVDSITVAALVNGTVMGRGANVFLAVYRPLTNAEGVTYHYIAFVEEVSA